MKIQDGKLKKTELTFKLLFGKEPGSPRMSIAVGQMARLHYFLSTDDLPAEAMVLFNDPEILY